MENLEVEIWKDITGYEGLYQISSFGRVKSLERQMWNGHVFWTSNERILKGCLSSNKKYLHVVLSKIDKNKTWQIHKLVAIHFLNHIPNKQKIIVDHLNNDSLNNHISNLQLISTRENTSKDKDKNKTSSKYIGVHYSKNDKKWISRIYISGKRIHLGSFNTELEAHEAYQHKLKSL